MKFKHSVIFGGKFYRAGMNVPMPEKNTTETAKTAEAEAKDTGQTSEKPKRKRRKAAKTADEGAVNDG